MLRRCCTVSNLRRASVLAAPKCTCACWLGGAHQQHSKPQCVVRPAANQMNCDSSGRALQSSEAYRRTQPYPWTRTSNRLVKMRLAGKWRGRYPFGTPHPGDPPPWAPPPSISALPSGTGFARTRSATCSCCATCGLRRWRGCTRWAAGCCWARATSASWATSRAGSSRRSGTTPPPPPAWWAWRAARISYGLTAYRDVLDAMRVASVVFKGT